MRNYKKYRSTVVDLFESFLAEKIDKRELIFALTEIDKKIRKNPKTLKGLWFKFFKGDTMATTIQGLKNSIGSYTNDNYIKECMQIATENLKGLQIYYS